MNNKLHDIGKKKDQKSPFDLRGVLSTGRKWRFLTPEFRPDLKPLFRFDGVLSLHVLKSLTTKPATITGERRPSGLFICENNVSEEEVKNVLLALLS